MAEITFSILDISQLNLTDGSGLGFYGAAGFGTSVALDQYQDRTFSTNSTGQDPGPAARNIKYVSASSGIMQAVAPTGANLLNMNGSEATLVINFAHDSNVLVQNAQLRIYDRTNINNPATGVKVKVAEIINFNGSGSVTSWLANAGSDITTVVGSGDALWWGSPWPSSYMYTPSGRPFYQNSAGINFYNFTDLELNQYGTGNRDSRLAGIVGGEATVGGTGIIVPLTNSPGNGGSGLLGNTSFKGKYTQYINSLTQTSVFGTSSYTGTGIAMSGAWGGITADTNHTWRIALSASPYTIGSKEFALYVSLEYLS